MMEQPIKVTEWQQTYTYDSGIHSGVNTQVPSVSSKCMGDDDEVYGKQYTIKKTTTTSYCQGGSQGQGQAQGRGGGLCCCLPGAVAVFLLGAAPHSLPVSCCCLKSPPAALLPCTEGTQPAPRRAELSTCCSHLAGSGESSRSQPTGRRLLRCSCLGSCLGAAVSCLCVPQT